ncbi:MAG: DUF4190 domain-containing protein [Chthoniobacteraceae bacterium]
MNPVPPPPPPPGMPPLPGAPARTDGLAVTALVLGIASISCLGCVAGVPAIVCGHMACSRIAESRSGVEGRGMAIAGLVMGYVSILLTIVAAIGFYFFAKQVPTIQSKAATPLVRAQSAQLSAALMRYRADYGQLPAVAPVQGEEVDAGALVKILAGANPRGTVYFQAGQNGIQVNGIPIDTWAQPLRIAIDLDGDGQVLVGSQKVRGIIAVWSCGPNKTSESGTGDDVPAW